MDADREPLMRMAAFEQVRRRSEVHDHLTANDLRPGFVFENERIPLVNLQRSIFKPQQMGLLLSIKTVFPKLGDKVWYDDQRETPFWRIGIYGSVAFIVRTPTRIAASR